MTASFDEQVRLAASLLSASRHAVALTGAGLSAESGIPTYRGPDGVWTRFGEPTIDGWDLFCSDPREWWRQALAAQEEGTPFSRGLDAAEPNAGHTAMAELERRGILKHVITQNIDGLHARAGSVGLTEIHGNRSLARCMHCAIRVPAAEVDTSELPPLCGECGGVMKNDVVMFGEGIPAAALAACEHHAYAADVFVVVGTSAVVYPAASFPLIAKRRGAAMIEVNPSETDLSGLADVQVRAPAGEALPAILAALG